MLAWTDSSSSGFNIYRRKQKDSTTANRTLWSEMWKSTLHMQRYHSWWHYQKGGSWVHQVSSMPHPCSVRVCVILCVSVCLQWWQSDTQAGATGETAGWPLWLNLGPVPPHTRISMCWNRVASCAFQSCCCATPAWLTALALNSGGGEVLGGKAMVARQLINSQRALSTVKNREMHI